MIYTFMPFALDYNLGRAYNVAMGLIGEDDWAVFLDHDAIWTTRDWYRQLEEVTRAFPDAGLVTAVQTRGWQPWQCLWPCLGPAPVRDDVRQHDMVSVRKLGSARAKTRTLLDVTDASGIAGVVILTSKRAWRDSGGFPDGMYCVDHGYHFALKRAGRRVYVHEGVLVYHWRRAFGDAPPREAPTAKDCPCAQIRRTEVPPSRRLKLP